MAKTYEEIIEKFDAHLKNSGRSYFSEFYVGVSDDAVNKLFKKHHVRLNSWWIYSTAVSAEDALKVARHYKKRGMLGNIAKPDKDARMVYCYVVTPLTVDRV